MDIMNIRPNININITLILILIFMMSMYQSALRVDVTSLDQEAARRQPIVDVVVSNVTRSRDVVKMVVQKLGMDHQDVVLMQLMAEVNYGSHQMHSKR